MSYPCPRARDRSAIGCPSFIAGATASGWESSIGRFSPADAVSGRWPRTVRMNDPHVRLLPRGYRGRRRHSDRGGGRYGAVTVQDVDDSVGVDGAVDFDRRAFAGEFVDGVEHLDGAAAGGGVGLE